MHSGYYDVDNIDHVNIFVVYMIYDYDDCIMQCVINKFNKSQCTYMSLPNLCMHGLAKLINKNTFNFHKVDVQAILEWA